MDNKRKPWRDLDLRPYDAGLDPHAYQEARKLIETYSTILIFTQKKSDADSVGAAIALATAIKQQFESKHKKIYIVGYEPFWDGIQVPDEFFLPKGQNTPLHKNDTLGITIDICSQRQIHDKELAFSCTTFIYFDHHEEHLLCNEWKERFKCALLINNNYFRSCCGLVLHFLNFNGTKNWVDGLPLSALEMLAKGHRSDTCTAQDSKGVWETFSELSRLGVNVMEIWRDMAKWSYGAFKQICHVINNGERDGDVMFLTMTSEMVTGKVPTTVFTAPLKFLFQHLEASTLIYFHYLLKPIEGHPAKKNIYVVPMKPNPALEELLSENGFRPNKGWYYKLGDVMEFSGGR